MTTMDADGTMDFDETDTAVAAHPVDVRVVNAERNLAPDFGAWQSFRVFTGDQPRQILPQAPKRHRAVVMIGLGPDATSTGAILIGSHAQVMNGQGAWMFYQSTLVFEAASEVWVAPNTALAGASTNLTVSVLDERYR